MAGSKRLWVDADRYLANAKRRIEAVPEGHAHGEKDEKCQTHADDNRVSRV
jgi:hypothetical protein